jgi:hypothetical protein
VHYHHKSAPVFADVTIRLVMFLMADWHGKLVDVNGAFLCGHFNGERIYMKIPRGFESFFRGDVVWLLSRTIYGLKQAAVAFWRELLKALISMKFAQSVADPSLYFKRVNGNLVVDAYFVAGKKALIFAAKKDMMDRFDCDDVKEYVGVKLTRDKRERLIKFTQPVLLKSFQDEFELPHGNVAGEVLHRGEKVDFLCY